ncbi:hypothetical protein JW868_04060 [Candidatus Woesearchaeota archaeon]|nr:hypothetical protein [Candidatus Woesearchaeota archaeon]
MSRNFLGPILLLSLALFLVPYAAGAPVGGNISNGTSSGATAQTEGQIYDVVAGNVSNVNVTGTSITERWAGFYGNISGGIKLADSSNNVFFEWTVSDLTDAVVYIANGSVSSWATTNIEAANYTLMPTYIEVDATDEFNNTFNATEAFTSTTYNIAGTPYAATWSGGSQGSLKTYSLYDKGGDVLIWAAKATAGSTGFDSSNLDYQALVPVNGSTSLSYTFYLELP